MGTSAIGRTRMTSGGERIVAHSSADVSFSMPVIVRAILDSVNSLLCTSMRCPCAGGGRLSKVARNTCTGDRYWTLPCSHFGEHCCLLYPA